LSSPDWESAESISHRLNILLSRLFKITLGLKYRGEYGPRMEFNRVEVEERLAQPVEQLLEPQLRTICLHCGAPAYRTGDLGNGGQWYCMHCNKYLGPNEMGQRAGIPLVR
jgi:hypothetical protein